MSFIQSLSYGVLLHLTRCISRIYFEERNDGARARKIGRWLGQVYYFALYNLSNYHKIIFACKIILLACKLSLKTEIPMQSSDQLTRVVYKIPISSSRAWPLGRVCARVKASFIQKHARRYNFLSLVYTILEQHNTYYVSYGDDTVYKVQSLHILYTIKYSSSCMQDTCIARALGQARRYGVLFD